MYFFCVEELVWIVTRQRTGVELIDGHAFIGHASILLHAWSPKNEGWVQSINVYF